MARSSTPCAKPVIVEATALQHDAPVSRSAPAWPVRNLSQLAVHAPSGAATNPELTSNLNTDKHLNIAVSADLSLTRIG